MQLRTLLNSFRYQVALTTTGQRILVEALKLTYTGRTGNITFSVKHQFLNDPNQSRTSGDYKKRFNAQQRAVLDKEAPVLLDPDATFRSYDISLLYIILQDLCGLENRSSSVWKAQTPGNELEYFIDQLKNERNNIAHGAEIQPLTRKELQQKLKRLQRLLASIIREACIASNTPLTLAGTLIDDVREEFRQLSTKVRELLSSKDRESLPQLQREIQVFQDVIEEKAKKESREELLERYPKLWGVTLAQWLYPDVKVEPSLNFTKLIIKEEVVMSPPSQHTPTTISHEELLQARCSNGSLPDVLIISGDGGMGKTTLLKFLLESWVKDPSQIQGLGDVSHLLYFQLRGSTISSWQELLLNHFSKTRVESNVPDDLFVRLFSKWRKVLLLDGYDEANEEARTLIDDLANGHTDVRIVVTTRPGSLEELTKKMGRKQVLNVEIKGIHSKDRHHFVENTLRGIPIEDITIPLDELKENIIQSLEHLNLEKEDLDVPLTLTLLVIREAVAPSQKSDNIYEDLTILMMGKTVERLMAGNRIRKVDVNDEDSVDDKIKKYYAFQKQIALRALKRQEYDLLPETVDELREKCKSLGLPFEETLSGFLTCKLTQKGFTYEKSWSFPHNKFLEHWGSHYIVNQLKDLKKTPLKIPSRIDLKAVMRAHPLTNIIFDANTDVGQYLWEQSQKGDSLVEILCNLANYYIRSQKKPIERYAPVIASLIMYKSSSRPVRRKKCDRKCRLVQAFSNLENILDARVQGFNGRYTSDVHMKFLNEIVCFTNNLRPQRSITETAEEEGKEEDEESTCGHQCRISPAQDVGKQNIDLTTDDSDRRESIFKIIDFGKAAIESSKKIANPETQEEGIRQLSGEIVKHKALLSKVWSRTRRHFRSIRENLRSGETMGN